MSTAAVAIARKPRKGRGDTSAWREIFQTEHEFAERALDIGRQNKNPRFKYLARVIMAIVTTNNPSIPIPDLHDADRAMQTEIQMEEKTSSGVYHAKEDKWIANFWDRVVKSKPVFEKLNNPLLTARYAVISEVVSAYQSERLCFDSKQIITSFNDKLETELNRARSKKKSAKKSKGVPHRVHQDA